MQRPRAIEFFLFQLIIYIFLWIWNDYIATLMTLTFSAISFFVLILSLIAEWIEPSKVPRWYYHFMIISLLTPLLAAAIFVGIMGADFAWAKG